VVFSFSKQLIDETIKVFKEEDGLNLSPEQANEYLNGMAGLFLAFAGHITPARTLLEEGRAECVADSYALRDLIIH